MIRIGVEDLLRRYVEGDVAHLQGRSRPAG